MCRTVVAWQLLLTVNGGAPHTHTQEGQRAAFRKTTPSGREKVNGSVTARAPNSFACGYLPLLADAFGWTPQLGANAGLYNRDLLRMQTRPGAIYERVLCLAEQSVGAASSFVRGSVGLPRAKSNCATTISPNQVTLEPPNSDRARSREKLALLLTSLQASAIL